LSAVGARSFIAFIAVLAIVALLGFGLIKKSSGGTGIGDPAPANSLPRLDGQGSGSLGDYRGGWVLVNVWASWCGPCREESPALQRFSAHHRSELAVLGIDTRDLTGDGRDFVAEHRLRYPQLRDADGDYARELGTTGVPESFLIAPSGKLAAHFPGPFRDEEAIAAFAAPAIESG
jgi:cytochrome c biogenesis protein CcmG, thiol:disulfide interchange protein DsbE